LAGDLTTEKGKKKEKRGTPKKCKASDAVHFLKGPCKATRKKRSKKMGRVGMTSRSRTREGGRNPKPPCAVPRICLRNRKLAKE